MTSLINFRKYFSIERFIHSLKTVLACIIGAVIIKIANIQSGQWIMITIIVVMCAQISVGGLMLKSYLRLLGTFVGCLIAIVALLLFGDSELVVLITIAFSSFFFSYLATSREDLVYTGTLGAVTTAIIMIGTNPTLEYAVSRFVEISIGIIIATSVSQLVLPIHASTHLRRAQANTLKRLKKYYKMCLAQSAPEQPVDYLSTDESIVQTITRQRQLAKEAIREPLGIFFDPEHFMQTLQSEKEILRAINFMHNALMQLQHVEKELLELNSLLLFNDAVLESFDVLIRVIEHNVVLEDRMHIPTLDGIKQDLALRESLFHDQMIYIDGFLFSAESLVHSLAGLAILFRIPVSELDTSPLKESV